MKKLLTDIELDFYELKCLIEYLDKNQGDTQLLKVAKRSLDNLTKRIGALNETFTSSFVMPPIPPLDKELITPDPIGFQKQEVKSPEPILEDSRIDSKQQELAVEETDTVKTNQPEVVDKTVSLGEQSVPTLMESSAMYKAFSLNDVFRYSRELFGNDKARLKQVVAEMDRLGGYEQAMGYLVTQVDCSLDDFAFQDMDEFLKAYFKN